MRYLPTLFAGAVISCFAVFSNTVFAEKRQLTALEAVQMKTIVEPNAAWIGLGFIASEFNYSPAGDRFVIVTRKPDVSNDLNHFDLLLYETDDVLKFVNARKSARMPQGRLLVRFSSQINGDRSQSGIRKVRWSSDGDHLSFIGENGREVSQVYTLNINSGDLIKRTDHDRHVAKYQVDFQSGRVFYVASVPYYYPGRGKSEYVTGLNPIWPLFDINEPVIDLNYQYYVKNADNFKATPIGAPFPDFATLDNVWMSPDGRWVINPRLVKKLPQEWLEKYPGFKPINEDNGEIFDDNTMSAKMSIYSQFVLIDLEKKTVESLFEAPTGGAVAGFADAVWMPDGKSVILGNTFLPLDGVSPGEKKRRQASSAVVEYKIKTGKIAHITDIADIKANGAGKMKAVSLDQNGILTVVRRSGGSQEGKPSSKQLFRKINGNWREIRSADKATKNRRLMLSIHQKMDKAPELLARDSSTDRERIITALNPEFDNLSFGRVEEIQWTDRDGVHWVSGLVYPVNYQAGHRYPVVIQTHGFHRGTFLLEGSPGISGAYAAQALANRDMFVLQLPDQRGHGMTAKEITIHRLGIESAIDTLNEKGLIDPSKVAVMGFSRSGLYAQDAITFSDYHFAAATIADASNISMTAYINWFGLGAPGMAFTESLLDGAVPWGERLNDWVKGNPVFHLDQVKTPLRLETYTGMKHWWDIYSILRRQAKPVEWVVVAPDNHNIRVHNLVLPGQRFSIEQGNVDWFDFWLNDRERAEIIPGTQETKASLEEQYKRWRKLRIQQEKSELNATKARSRR